MKLYLIRHGQSEMNADARYTGWKQAKLTADGEADAKRAGELLRGIAFDKVYSSDLVRAMRTRELALPQYDCEPTELLREFDVGEFTGERFSDCEEKYGEVYRKCRRDADYSAVNGESYSEVRARVEKFLGMTAAGSFENIAAFCHGGVICTVLETVLEVRIARGKFRCDNGSISVFENDGGGWRLTQWNYRGGLGL